MIFLSLLFAYLLPSLVLAGSPGALKALSGRDYSHLLKRIDDEQLPARMSLVRKHSIAVPRTLQVPSIPIRRSSPAGLLVAARQLSCDAGYSACADGNGCCPSGAECCTEVAMCASMKMPFKTLVSSHLFPSPPFSIQAALAALVAVPRAARTMVYAGTSSLCCFSP